MLSNFLQMLSALLEIPTSLGPQACAEHNRRQAALSAELGFALPRNDRFGRFPVLPYLVLEKI